LVYIPAPESVGIGNPSGLDFFSRRKDANIALKSFKNISIAIAIRIPVL
jgi:hypothetical protein